MELKIYKGSEVDKIYKVQEAHISYGIAEDMIKFLSESFSGLDLESASDLAVVNTLAMMIAGSFSIASDLVKSVIPEISDEELRAVRLDDLLTFIVELIQYSVSGFAKVFSGLSKKKKSLTARK